MFKILISITISSIATTFITLYFTSAFFNGVISELKEENNLQDLALSHLLIKDMDANDLSSLRKNIESQYKTSLIHADSENSYIHLRKDACLIHKAIGEHWLANSQEYSVLTEERELIQSVLAYWQGVNCEK